MSESLPKISIVILTYNQEAFIRRALDSVLRQKEWVYEIIVCDDCSEDNNWNIITEYANKYPRLIKPFRNEKNLGIFGNQENSWSLPTGDLIIYLAGDDAICDGLFKEIYKFIRKENIDYTKGSFCLYSDSKIVMPDGTERLRSNRMIMNGYDAKSLKIRGLVGSSRGIFYSKELVKRFKPVSKNIGIYTDGLYDIQVQLFSDKNYYTDFIGAIYYEGIGIASRTPSSESKKSLLLLYNELYNTIDFTKNDKFYLLFKKESLLYFMEPSVKKFINTWRYYMRSLNINFGLNFGADSKLLLKMILTFFNWMKKYNKSDLNQKS